MFSLYCMIEWAILTTNQNNNVKRNPVGLKWLKLDQQKKLNQSPQRKPRTPKHGTVDMQPTEYVDDEPPIVGAKPVGEAKLKSRANTAVQSWSEKQLALLNVQNVLIWFQHVEPVKLVVPVEPVEPKRNPDAQVVTKLGMHKHRETSISTTFEPNNLNPKSKDRRRQPRLCMICLRAL